MGYIDQSNNVTLNAFYTQKGRTFYLNGTDIDKTVTSFCLGDSDVNYIIGINSNILPSGFIPDLTGDYNGCLNGIAEGTVIKNLVSLTGSTNSNTITIPDQQEIRFFSDKNQYIGDNTLNLNIDLGKYINWLQYYGKYSTNSSDSYNKIDQTLSSPFIKFYNYVGVYNTTNDSVDTTTDVRFTFSSGDYNNYEQLNRFLLDTTLPSSFRTVIPNNSYLSSPLSFLFTSMNNQGNNAGNTGVIINNRDYIYLVTDNANNITTTYTYNQVNSGITLDTTINYTIVPAVILSYYNNGSLIKETFSLRTDSNNTNLINGTISNNSNQYLKLFINSNNKTLIVREAELLQNFIVSRTDLFTLNNNGIYNSRPITIYCKSNVDDTINHGVIKLSFTYNPNLIYTPIPNDTFIL
jgi:hypothetical protein